MTTRKQADQALERASGASGVGRGPVPAAAGQRALHSSLRMLQPERRPQEEIR